MAIGLGAANATGISLAFQPHQVQLCLALLFFSTLALLTVSGNRLSATASYAAADNRSSTDLPHNLDHTSSPALLFLCVVYLSVAGSSSLMTPQELLQTSVNSLNSSKPQVLQTAAAAVVLAPAAAAAAAVG